MDPPPVQYAQTPDGLGLAYMTWGEGPPLLILRVDDWSNIQEEWRIPEMAAWYADLATAWRVVRFDHRGAGRSDPSEAVGFDDYLLDIATVQAAADAAPAVVLAEGPAATLALELAARRPDALHGLALVNPAIDWDTFSPEELTYPHLQALRQANPAAWYDTVALWRGFRERASREAFVRMVRSNESEHLVQNMAWGRHAVGDTLAAIRVPCVAIQLVGAVKSANSAARIARELPGAKLVSLEAEGQELAFVDRAGLLRALDSLRPRPAASSQGEQGFRTILFTDVEDSTELVVQHGDAKYRDLLADHERLVREALATHGGNEIKTIGDSFMCWFSSASAALDAAIAMQRAITGHYGDTLRIRIGVHAGEPIQEADGDLYGTSVVRASRIMGQADGGQILVSQVVTDLVEGKGYLFSDAGEFALKGYERPVHLFAVAWETD